MSRIAYVDAIAGVAGDMLLGALLDAGADDEYVRSGLGALGIDGLTLQTRTAMRHGIAARQVEIGAAEPQPPRERTWRAIEHMITDAALPRRVERRAQSVFAALAAAEGRIHNVDPGEVHFHEVGALDSIGDVCGIALALESLEVDEIACSPLPAARGWVESAHGRLPLPAPATLELLRGAPLRGVDLEVELVTPTGAAILAGLAASFGTVPAMRLDSVGYGAGTRELEQLPNVVRVLIGQREMAAGRGHGGRALLIETNLDDLTPELVPDAVERCFAAGALDVWVSTAQMKKNRPGIVLSALARHADERAVVEAILRETTTLGVRVSAVDRWELDRVWRTAHVDGEPIRVKLGLLDSEQVNAAPEHDDCLAAARRLGRPVKDVWAAALAASSEQR